MDIIKSKYRLQAMQEVEIETRRAEYEKDGASRLELKMLSTPALRRYIPWLYTHGGMLCMRCYSPDAADGVLSEHGCRIATKRDEKKFMRRMKAVVRCWCISGFVKKE